jgi:hypothetical protein
MSRAYYLAVVLIAACSAFAAETANVFIYRPGRFVGSAITPDIYYDGHRLTSVPTGAYFGGIFPVGVHTFELDGKQSGARMTLEPGRSYYIRLAIEPGFWAGIPAMTVVQPEQGSYESEKLQHVTGAEVRDHTIPWVIDPAYPQRTTMERMREIARDVTARLRLPERISKKLVDVWGTPFQYERSADRKSFTLISAGSDGTFDPESWGGPLGHLETAAMDCVMIGERSKATFQRFWQTNPPPTAAAPSSSSP